MSNRFTPRALRPDITTWAQLAAIATTELAVPSIIGWVESTGGALIFTELKPGTDATDTAAGIQRPDDYDAATNAVVWYKVSA